MATKLETNSASRGSLVVKCDGHLVQEYQIKKLNVSISSSELSDICIQDKELGKNKITISYQQENDLEPLITTALSSISINGKIIEKSKNHMVLSHELKNKDKITIGSHEIEYKKSILILSLPAPNTSTKYRNNASITLLKDGKVLLKMPIINEKIFIANIKDCDLPLEEELLGRKGLTIGSGKQPYLTSHVGPIYFNNKLISSLTHTPLIAHELLKENDRIRIGSYEIIYHVENIPNDPVDKINNILETASLARTEIENLLVSSEHALFSTSKPSSPLLSTEFLKAENHVTELLNQSLETSLRISKSISPANEVVRSLELCNESLYELTPECRQENLKSSNTPTTNNEPNYFFGLLGDKQSTFDKPASISDRDQRRKLEGNILPMKAQKKEIKIVEAPVPQKANIPSPVVRTATPPLSVYQPPVAVPVQPSVDMSVRCPKCNSSQITANKKGFSLGKALIGAAIVPFGVLGAIGTGFIGSGKVKITCLACGHDWIAGKK